MTKKIILFDEVALGLHHGLEPGPEPAAGERQKGAQHVGEPVDDGRLEGLLGVVGSAVDGPLTCPPHVVVEGAAVGAAGRPVIFTPEVGQVLF